MPVSACKTVRQWRVASPGECMTPRRFSSTSPGMLARACTAVGVNPVQLAQLRLLRSASPAQQIVSEKLKHCKTCVCVCAAQHKSHEMSSVYDCLVGMMMALMHTEVGCSIQAKTSMLECLEMEGGSLIALRHHLCCSQ